MRSMTKPVPRQRGMALIVVLMIVSLMTVIATEVMFRQDRFRARTENLTDWDQRYQYAIAAETVAIQGLIDDLEDDRNNNALVDDCVEEQWPVNLPPTPYEDAVLSATVQDLQGRFNLNWLVTQQGTEFIRDEIWRERLASLLQATLTEPGKAERLSHEMVDWIDSNNIVDGIEGAEDPDYRWRRTPNAPAMHESELRALRSMTAGDIPDPLFWGLFSALPLDARLNVNTAPQPVLDAVFADNVGSAGRQQIVAMREEGPISSIDELMAQAPFSAMEADARQALQEKLDVRSSYFQVMVDVRRNDQRSRLVTRIRRLEQGPTEVFSRQLVPILGPLEPPCNPFYSEPLADGINSDG
ncbi:type II secretion system minor pseudopilin GspK [Alcanivorax limicola]|uniref:type II secretion system minor pseudopilin GspK n=1 Tax=Alcanivorax limicola TaxID=2874102 RepID=UPI001CBE72F5|nr:type II secretion system minor pseudopilin GspK [Alcanivorax limicola]